MSAKFPRIVGVIYLINFSKETDAFRVNKIGHSMSFIQLVFKNNRLEISNGPSAVGPGRPYSISALLDSFQLLTPGCMLKLFS